MLVEYEDNGAWFPYYVLWGGHSYVKRVNAYAYGEPFEWTSQLSEAWFSLSPLEAHLEAVRLGLVMLRKIGSQ